MRPELRQEMVGLGMVVIRRSFVGFIGIFTEAEAEAEEVDVFGESRGAL